MLDLAGGRSVLEGFCKWTICKRGQAPGEAAQTMGLDHFVKDSAFSTAVCNILVNIIHTSYNVSGKPKTEELLVIFPERDLFPWCSLAHRVLQPSPFSLIKPVFTKEDETLQNRGFFFQAGTPEISYQNTFRLISKVIGYLHLLVNKVSNYLILTEP